MFHFVPSLFHEKFKYIYKNMLNRGLLRKEFDGLCEKFSNLVVKEVVKAPYVKGAKEFLDSCAARYKCFVASGTPQEEMKEIIRQRRMSGYFAAVYGSPQKKPDIVTRIIVSNNFLPEEVICVGDAMSDYRAAEANSVRFVARVSSEKDIFKDVNCVKIMNLSGLESIIEGLQIKVA